MIRTEEELKAKIAAYNEKKIKRDFLVQEEKIVEKPKKSRKKREFLVQEENNSFSFEQPEQPREKPETSFEVHKDEEPQY